MAARTAAAVTPLPDSQGSRRLDHFDEWLRKKGCRAAAWCQRTSSSAPGSSRNPPTSAASQERGFGPRQHHGGVWTGSQPLEAKDVMLPPQKEIPARLRDSSMGMVIFRCSQLAVLSPVHTAPGPQPQKENSVSYTQTKKGGSSISGTNQISAIQQRRSGRGRRVSPGLRSDSAGLPWWPCAVVGGSEGSEGHKGCVRNHLLVPCALNMEFYVASV